jgi:hypothetical protein
MPLLQLEYPEMTTEGVQRFSWLKLWADTQGSRRDRSGDGPVSKMSFLEAHCRTLPHPIKCRKFFSTPLLFLVPHICAVLTSQPLHAKAAERKFFQNLTCFNALGVVYFAQKNLSRHPFVALRIG